MFMQLSSFRECTRLLKTIMYFAMETFTALVSSEKQAKPPSRRSMKVFKIPICIGFIAAMLLPYAVKSDENYCKHSKDHLLCDLLKTDCVERREITFSDRMKKMIVDAHNKARNEVALGIARGLDNNKFQQASNMREISWSDLLAVAAQRMTNRCVLSGSKPEQRRFSFFGKTSILGEYFFTAKSSAVQPIMTLKDVMNEVDKWKMQYNTSILFQSANHKQPYAHIVWADTYLIGCASTGFKGKSTNAVIVTCLYGPAEDAMNQRVYQKGSPCSNCADGGLCSSTYKGLCSSKDLRRPSISDFTEGREDILPRPKRDVTGEGNDATKPTTTTTESSESSGATKPSTPKPDAAKPSTPNPDAVKPSTPKPDAAKPSTPNPDAAKPSTPNPDATKPSTPKPDATNTTGSEDTKPTRSRWKANSAPLAKEEFWFLIVASVFVFLA